MFAFRCTRAIGFTEASRRNIWTAYWLAVRLPSDHKITSIKSLYGFRDAHTHDHRAARVGFSTPAGQGEPGLPMLAVRAFGNVIGPPTPAPSAFVSVVVRTRGTHGRDRSTDPRRWSVSI
jgi:hypothetical protein